MNGSLDPMENPDDFFGNEEPLDDLTLDAFESGMQNPPGFTDPMVESDEMLMDDLAWQLDEVEANIEKNAPVLPEPDIIGGNEPNGQPGHKSIEEQGTLPEDDPESYDDEVEPEETDENPQSLVFQNKFTFVAPPDQSKLTLHRGDSGGGSHHGDGLLFKQHTSRASTGARGGGSSRICPESNELINIERCGSCEKYRCWPDGTDEEPRECWYDWQARSHHDSSESEEY